MNIVALSRISSSAAGIYYATSALYRALACAGAQVLVLGCEDRFFQKEKVLWCPVQVVAYRAFGPLSFSSELRKLLARNAPNLVHLHGLWQYDQWAALQWQKCSGRPVIISPHGMLDSWAVRNSAWKKKLVGALFANESLRSASCIHALCQSEAEAIRAYGLKTPIAVIPNGVELPEVGIRASRTGKKRLLFLGRIHPKKGLAELLPAWGKLRPTEWELLIAGWDDGGYELGLKAQVAELGIGDSVTFLGSQYGTEKDALLRSVDAFILPSFSEGLPMSVLEASSYSLPVVMTDFCNLPVGFDAEAALRIEPEPDSIFQGLEILMGIDEVERAAMGSKGRKLVEEQFSWDQIAAEMKAVYAWCLGGDKPACVLDR